MVPFMPANARACLVDLSFSRIAGTVENFEALSALLSLCHRRRPTSGALVLVGNPIVSMRSSEWFSLIAQTHPDELNLHLIWLAPESVQPPIDSIEAQWRLLPQLSPVYRPWYFEV
jgi:hypothetical protein